MKRNSFLKTSLFAATSLLPTGTLFARSFKKPRVDKGFMVEAGNARFDKKISLFEGDVFSTKVATSDTKGDIFVFESTRFKEGGPYMHYHFEQDEWWYVLSGEFVIQVGDKTWHAKAGDSVFGPRMIPHAFTKVGDGEAKLLMFFQPAGKMEEMFQKISEGATKNMTETELEKFRLEHGTKKVGPPIGHFKKW